MGARLEESGDALARARTWVWMRWRSAELRMRQAYAILEAAESKAGVRRELERLAASFERASTAYAAAEPNL
jgi:hypothetical protein